MYMLYSNEKKGELLKKAKGDHENKECDQLDTVAPSRQHSDEQDLSLKKRNTVNCLVALTHV